MKSLSEIKLVLADPATNITQPKEASDDYYIARGKILKDEYNMSWKTICNHKDISGKETIDNIEQAESPKAKNAHNNNDCATKIQPIHDFNKIGWIFYCPKITFFCVWVFSLEH